MTTAAAIGEKIAPIPLMARTLFTAWSGLSGFRSTISADVNVSTIPDDIPTKSIRHNLIHSTSIKAMQGRNTAYPSKAMIKAFLLSTPAKKIPVNKAISIKPMLCVAKRKPATGEPSFCALTNVSTGEMETNTIRNKINSKPRSKFLFSFIHSNYTLYSKINQVFAYR
jgi:hypothetical protein